MTDDFLSSLDDPAGEPTRLPELDGVMARGRQIRTRRYAALAASAAVVTAVVGVAAFGAVPGLSADRTGQTIAPATQPATPTSPVPTVSGNGRQVVSVAPGGAGPATARHSASPPAVAPTVDPCHASPSAAPPSAEPASPDPSATPVAPPAPSASATPCGTAEPSATPTDTSSPEPDGSPTAMPPVEEPTAQALDQGPESS